MVDITKTNIYRAYAPHSWNMLAEKIARGEDPSLGDLSRALRENDDPPPMEVRRYVADLLMGKIKRKRGRKPRSRIRQLARKAVVEDPIRTRVQRWKAAFEFLGERGRVLHGGAYAEAVAKVAEETGLSPEAVDKMVYPRTPRRRG